MIHEEAEGGWNAPGLIHEGRTPAMERTGVDSRKGDQEGARNRDEGVVRVRNGPEPLANQAPHT